MHMIKENLKIEA